MLNMKSMLQKNGTARKLRSLLALFLILAIVNVANATNYWVGNSNVTLNAQAVTGTLYTTSDISATGTSVSSPTLSFTDIINIVGTGTLTVSGTSSTVGGIVISSGSISIATSQKLYIGGNGGAPTVTTCSSSATTNVTTITCASTTGLATGQSVTVTSGTGAFPANTTISSITDATHFVVSATPSTALSAATVTINNPANLVMTGGTIANSGTLYINGNFAGSADGTTTQATGTISGSGTFLFNGSAALGTSGNINGTTGVATIGTGSAPQIFYADFSASTFTGGFQMYNYVQLGGTTNLPCKFKNGNTSTAGSLLDLNGKSLTTTNYYLATPISSPYNLLRGGGNSALIINGSGTANTIFMDQNTTNTSSATNALNLQMVSGTTTSPITLYNSMYLASSAKLTKGIVYLNGQTVTAATFPAATSASFLASGVSGTAGTGYATITSPSTTSSATIVPIGTYNTYLPVSFSNTNNSTSYTVGVTALTTSNVVTSSSCAPFQWSITSTVSGTQSDITFTSTSTTGISSTSQLGVLTTGKTGYASMTTNLATASSYSGNSATFNSYTLPANTTLNTFFVGANGAVYPFPVITGAPTLTATSATYNNTASTYSISGSNIASFSSTTGLPPGLSIATSGTVTNGVYSAGQITGTPSSSAGSPYTVSIVASNIAGTASATLVYTINNNPTVTSSTTATALVGGTFNYTITASGGANSFTASIPTTNSLSSSLALSGAVISGTLGAGTAGNYSIPLTATNTTTNLSCTACPTLTLNVLDVPTVASISPATSKVDTITSGSITLTVSGTNFVNGFSTVNWGSTALTTTFVNASQLTALVPSSLLGNSVSNSAATISVTNAGSNTGATTPASISAPSTTNKSYTLTALIPTITAISPSAAVAGGASFTIIVRGTNLSSISKITWAGTTLVTTFVAATTISGTSYAAYLSATVPNTSIATAGTVSVGITNTFADVTTAVTTSNQTFTIYAAGASWAFTTNGNPVIGSNIGTATTFTSGSSNLTGITNANFVAGTGLNFSPSGSGTSASATWPAEALNGTPSFTTANNPATFNGFNSYLSSATPTVVSRYVQFDVAPNTNFDFVAKNIVIPISNNTSTGSIQYAAAYSLDNWTTYTSMMPTSTNSATNIVVIPSTTTGSNLVNTAGNNWANLTFTPSTGINVLSGNTLSVRLLVYSNKSTAQTGTVNLTNVNIAGTSQAVYASPLLTSSTSAINGTQNQAYNSTTPLYQFTASTTSGTVSYSASGLPAGLTINSSTGKVTGTPTTVGTSTVTFTADNGNLRPTTQAIILNIAGPIYTPTISEASTSSTTSVRSITADAGSFSMYVTGTNFVNGSSYVTWNGNPITPTSTTSTKLTVTIPASYILASNNTGSNTVQIGTYTTGAIDQTTSASAQSSSSTITFTINNPTPTISLVNPAGATTSGGTLTVYGTNFTTGSVIKWGNTALTVLTQTSTQLTATIPTLSGSSATVTVANTLAGSTITSSGKTFYIGNASATWVSGSSNLPTLVPSSGILNSTITTTPNAIGGNVVSYSTGQVQCYTAADGSYTTVSSDFKGLLLSTTTPNTTTTVTSRSVDFYIAPVSGYNLSVGSVSIPVSTSGSSGSSVYSVGYSTDCGSTFTQLNSSSANTTGTTSTTNGTVTNTYDVLIPATGTAITTFVPSTPFTVTPTGNPLIIRVIGWRRSNSGTGYTVNVGPMSIVATSAQIPTPGAPTIDSLNDNNGNVDVYFSAPSIIGTSAISSYTVYAYANGSTVANALNYPKNINVVNDSTNTATIAFHIRAYGLTNGTSYSFKVSATNNAGEGLLSAFSSSVTPSNITTYVAGTGWTNGAPDATQSATISSGKVDLSSLPGVTKLTINAGASATLSTTLPVSGATIINNGTISGSGTIVLNSTTGSQTVSGVGTFPNITVSNSNGVTLSGTQTVTGVVAVTSGTLTIPSGATVVLKSTSIDNSAVIGQVCSTCKISGTITVERFIPAGYRAYRDLATGVYNGTTYAQNPAAMSNGSIFTNWQENGSYNNAGYGMFITGSTPNTSGSTQLQNIIDATTGLDVSKNSVPSVYMYNNGYNAALTVSPFVNITNTKSSLLSPFQTYRILVRGDRSFDLYKTPIQSYGYVLGLRSYNSTSIRSTGSLVTGDVVYNTSGVQNANINSGAFVSQVNGYNIGLTNGNPLLGNGYGWSMIANPYICPVLWDNGTAINSGITNSKGLGVYNNSGTTIANINNRGTIDVSSTYYYLDPTTGATGKYISCTSAGCSNGTLAEIQSGQSIFLRSTTTNPSVIFKEANKVPTDKKQGVFGVGSINILPIVLNRNIDATIGYQKVDMATLYFNKNYSNKLATEDGEKLIGSNDNIYINESGTKLGVDGRNIPTVNDKVAVEMEMISSADYQLAIDASSYNANGLTTYVYDAFTKTYTLISKDANNIINFKVDTGVKASFVNRFSIVFKAASLPISNITVTTKQLNSCVNVIWTAVGATKTTSYVVEKSIDGVSFTTIVTTTANSYTDNSALGTVYYRIKATDVDGSETYSNVVKLTINNLSLNTIAVYPNPFIGKTINVSFANMLKGKYKVSITNFIGQKVVSTLINHNGGTTVNAIATGVLVKGMYNVTIANEEGKQVYQSNVEAQ